MQSPLITARLVPDDRRLNFLPEAFTTRMMMRAESLVFYQADMLSKQYRGGLWDFYSLSNGGFYLVPTCAKRFDVSVVGNGYEGNVSADAFGIIVTLFVYGALVFIDDATLQEKYSNHYHQLRDFAIEHTEREAILNAID
ncbi:antirestriction protein [Caballeronia calidae]|uniref:Antirestriction protein n=1 Tax=Caballeronia calidae TaxID=1777139 RepID=A0A158E846_9BURK|nr:antirestriction protein [Caballeronia calidae]SAL03039.1 antirestriction protein [Caballeronia calidae]